MKFRSGFVSNSSSSSFILYGARIKQDTSMDEEFFDKCNEIFGTVHDGNYILIGSTIMSDVESYNIKKIDLSDIEKSELNNNIIDFLTEHKIAVSDIEFGTFAGSDYH